MISPTKYLISERQNKKYLKNDFPLYVLSKLKILTIFVYLTGVKFPLLLGKRRLWRFLSKKNFNFWYAKYRFTKLLSCKIFQTPFLRKASLFPKEMDFTGKWDIIIISVLFFVADSCQSESKRSKKRDDWNQFLSQILLPFSYNYTSLLRGFIFQTHSWYLDILCVFSLFIMVY